MIRRALLVVALCCPTTLAQPPTTKWCNSNGTRIYYREAGRGEALILVHGFGGDSSELWTTHSPGLMKSYRVVAVDQRGFGQSDKPVREQAYGLEMVNDLVRLLDHLKVEKAHFVGWSMGGAVVAKLAMTNPDRVLSATIGAPPPTSRPRNEFENIASAVAEGLLKRDGAPLLRSMMPKGAPLPPPNVLKAMNKEFFEGHDPKVLAACARALPELCSESEQRKRCSMPVLAIVGSRDTVAASDLKAFSDTLPNATFVKIDGRAHDLPSSKKFWDEVTEFISASGSN